MRVACALLLCVLSVKSWALSLNAPPPICQLAGGDGRLILYSAFHQEIREETYRHADGTWNDAALAVLGRVMRSPDGATTPIDRRLIQLLDQLQDHFGAEVVEIISGYRSPAYNGQLKAQGHAVAADSRHMTGDAADVHLDEITEEAVRDYARSLRCGGVGFYPALHFVHLDLGPVRHWGEPRGGRKLVGEPPIVLQTDRNYYFAGDPLHVRTSGELQHFSSGTWKAIRQLSPTTLRFEPGVLPYGKYRLRLSVPVAGYSNEFYWKKR